jgi:CoA binding protein
VSQECVHWALRRFPLQPEPFLHRTEKREPRTGAMIANGTWPSCGNYRIRSQTIALSSIGFWRCNDQSRRGRQSDPSAVEEGRARRLPGESYMQTFESDRRYADLKSIPGGVDGVVIITRPEGTDRIVQDCAEAKVRRVWMHQSLGKGSSVSPEAIEYCRQHDISVIAGACPMMFGPGADFGHTCMRWFLELTGGLPA